MKWKIVFSVLTLFSVLSVAFIPGWVLSALPAVDIVSVQSKFYQDIIYCSGEIVEKQVKEIYLFTPVIAQNVFVEVGDRVQRGQTLAKINAELTKATLEQGAVYKEEKSALPANRTEIAAMAAQYGIGTEELETAMKVHSTSAKQASFSDSEEKFIPSEITAPISGLVTAVNLQSDVLTKTEQPVLVVSDDSAYAACVLVKEADIAQVKQGDSAVISGIGFEGKYYNAVVSKIYPTAQKSANGTTQQTVVRVELSIQGSDSNLKPGFTAKAAISTQSGGTMLTIPYEAIGQDEGNHEFVYVYANNSLEKRNIKTGRERVSEVEVLEGLQTGERIVLAPESISGSKYFVYAKQKEAGT